MNSTRLAAMASALVLLSSPAYATCMDRSDMHKILNASGYFMSVAGLDKYGHLTSFWLGDNGYVLLIEDINQACILAEGQDYWSIKEMGL